MTVRHSLVFVSVFCTIPAAAQTVAPDVLRQASTHFQTGLDRARQGDLLAALQEFEIAYAISPHFSVLYNIAQARSTLGQPVLAVAAFEKYLADGGAQIPGARREEVVALLESNRKRIGKLQIVAAPGAEPRVWLDGLELPREQYGAPIELATGDHSILWSSGGTVQSQAISIAAATLTELRIAAPPQVEATALPAQLAVVCNVPGVEVSVNEAPRGTTPVSAPLRVAAGPVRVAFSRPGYTAPTRSLTPHSGEALTVACSARPNLPLAPQHAANLVVRPTPADAEVRVDGQRFLGATLPDGVHQLRVEREGYLAEERSISLRAGNANVYHLTLVPTPATRAREERARAHRKNWSILLGGTGATFLATGLGVFVWNSGRYDDWRSTHAQSTIDSSSRRAASIQRADDAAIGLTALGTGLALGAAWLLWGE